MIIQQLYKNLDKISANKLRIKNIREVQQYMLSLIFIRFKEILKTGDEIKITEFLENELFFEEIDSEFVAAIVLVIKNKENDFVDSLKEYYSQKGTRGIKFCWGHILV